MADVFTLQKIQKKQDVIIDKNSQAFISSLEKMLEDVSKKTVKLLSGAPGGVVDTAFVLNNKRNIENILVETGYYEMAEGYVSQFPKQLSLLKQQYAALGKKPILSEAGKVSVQALLESNAETFTNYGTTISKQLYDGILRVALSGEKMSDIIGQVQKISGDIPLSSINTAANTKYMEFIRGSAEIVAKDAGYTKYIYLGPVDGLIRPFCMARVGNVYTKEEILDMNNGQIDNVLMTGGGYNCRHKWVAVPDDYDTTDEEKADFERLKENAEDIKSGA